MSSQGNNGNCANPMFTVPRIKRNQVTGGAIDEFKKLLDLLNKKELNPDNKKFGAQNIKNKNQTERPYELKNEINELTTHILNEENKIKNLKYAYERRVHKNEMNRQRLNQLRNELIVKDMVN